MTTRALDDVILAAVAQLAPHAYGVTIRARAGALLHGATPSVGSVHRALTRLERGGLVRATMGDPTPVRGGRAKRLFSITPVGATALAKAQRAARHRAVAMAPTWRPT
jgi:DNA-binding PadR family transcriptional regulator